MRLTVLLPLFLASLCASVQAASWLDLRIGGVGLRVEFVSSEAERRQGLMGRQQLPANQGMLFRFPRSKTQCLWMKNTTLPLSAAFMDELGQIVDIIDLEPLSTDLRCSQQPARFALEANQGWFRQHGVSVGDRVMGLPLSD